MLNKLKSDLFQNYCERGELFRWLKYGSKGPGWWHEDTFRVGFIIMMPSGLIGMLSVWICSFLRAETGLSLESGFRVGAFVGGLLGVALLVSQYIMRIFKSKKRKSLGLDSYDQVGEGSDWLPRQ